MLIGSPALICRLASVRFLLLNLLDTVDWEQILVSNVFCEEERSVIVLGLLRHMSVFRVRKAHLRVTRWSENVLRLSLFSELLRENLALDVGIGSDVRNWQGDSLAHDLGIEVVTLDFFLDLA